MPRLDATKIEYAPAGFTTRKWKRRVPGQTAVDQFNACCRELGVFLLSRHYDNGTLAFFNEGVEKKHPALLAALRMGNMTQGRVLPPQFTRKSREPMVWTRIHPTFAHTVAGWGMQDTITVTCYKPGMAGQPADVIFKYNGRTFEEI